MMYAGVMGVFAYGLNAYEVGVCHDRARDAKHKQDSGRSGGGRFLVLLSCGIASYSIVSLCNVLYRIVIRTLIISTIL